jgi:hypothetical protein
MVTLFVSKDLCKEVLRRIITFGSCLFNVVFVERNSFFLALRVGLEHLSCVSAHSYRVGLVVGFTSK